MVEYIGDTVAKRHSRWHEFDPILMLQGKHWTSGELFAYQLWRKVSYNFMDLDKELEVIFLCSKLHFVRPHDR